MITETFSRKFWSIWYVPDQRALHKESSRTETKTFAEKQKNCNPFDLLTYVILGLA